MNAQVIIIGNKIKCRYIIWFTRRVSAESEVHLHVRDLLTHRENLCGLCCSSS